MYFYRIVLNTSQPVPGFIKETKRKDMKTLTLSTLFVFVAISTVFPQDIEAVLKDRLRVYDRSSAANSRLEPGEKIRIEGYILGIDGSGNLSWKLATSNGERFMQPRDFNALEIDYAALSPLQIWNLAVLRSQALESRNKLGKGYELRAELEEEYVKLEQQLSFVTDPYLDDYLSALLRQIYTGTMPLERRGALHVRLFDSNEPMSFACANGAIYLSTGLLSALRTEDELFAIMASEAAHIILDHSVYNYQLQEQRIARAQFWGNLLTVAAAVGEVAAANSLYRRGYGDVYWAYDFGSFTHAISNLSFAVAYKIATRLGMEYTTVQYQETDEVVAQLMENLGRDKTALASALDRIISYYADTNNFQALEEDVRLKNMRTRQLRARQQTKAPEPSLDLAYLRHISLLNLMTATQEYALSRYERARQFSQLNIDAGIAVPEDFMLQSAVIRRLHTVPEELEKAFVYLAQAEARARMLPREYHVEKALVHLRLGQLPEAKAALEAYQAKDPYAAAASYEAESAMQWWVRNMLEKL